MSLPNLTDFDAHLSGGGDDTEKDDTLDAAVDIVEGIVGPLQVAAVTEIHRGISSSLLVLRQAPVVALSSIASGYGSVFTALTVSDYDLDADAGVVRAVNGGRFRGDFQVTYTVGRSDVPVAIREAILIIAAHLWETQRGVAPSALSLQGADVADTFSPGLGYAVPNRARELLAPYALGPVVA